MDPLDGTKEFVKKNGEFTVNIALIEGTTPTLGVIYLPVLGSPLPRRYSPGLLGTSAGQEQEAGLGNSPPATPTRVVKSRSHPSPDLEALLETLPAYESVSRGSALKFCALAAGEADFYPRFGPTWEWDTAAGQAIVTAAGGVMVALDGNPFHLQQTQPSQWPLPGGSESGLAERVGNAR